MRTVLRWVLDIFGVACCLIAAAHIFIGPRSYLGGNTPNATLDGDIRMVMVLFFAFGVACVWAARDLTRRAGAIHLLMLLFFIGGLVRLLTVAYVGWPNGFYLAMGAVELVLPPVYMMLLQRLTGRRATADLAALAH
jgi:Domain of unknown function (DUF4345)